MLKRILLGFVGVVLVLAAAVVGSFAAWGYVTFGNGGSLRYDLGTVVPGADETSIVVDVDRFGASIPYLDAVGTTQLAARSAQPGGSATSLFVGAARTPDADAFVKGTPYAVGIRTAGGWEVRQIPGPATLPAATTVPWLAQATGVTALLDVPTTRPLTLVITRADGAPVGAVIVAADFAVPTAQTWAMWMAIGAGIALIVGIVFLVLALRRRRPRGAHEAGAEEPVPTVAAAAVAATVAGEPAADSITSVDSDDDADTTAEPSAAPDAVPAGQDPPTEAIALPAGQVVPEEPPADEVPDADPPVDVVPVEDAPAALAQSEDDLPVAPEAEVPDAERTAEIPVIVEPDVSDPEADEHPST